MFFTTYLMTAFPNQAIADDQFSQQVADSTITATLEEIDHSFTEVTLGFDTALSPADEATLDGIVATHTATGRITEGLVASLSNGLFENEEGFATDGRKVGEGPGAGTGVPLYWSQGAWRVFSTDAPVQT